MKLIYKPIGIVLGILGGMLGKRVFDAVWAKVDEEEPPRATTRDTRLVKVIGAAAMQGVIYKVVRVLVDRGGARGWEHLTGFWPGEKKPDAA